MSFSRIYAVFLRQLFLIKSNPTRLVPIFLWMIIDVIQWGFITKYLGSFGGATFSFITVVLGAVILWDLVNRVQQGVMTSFLEDVWSQNFINFFASPLRIREYVGGLILTSTFAAAMAIGLMALIAGLGFGYNILKTGLLLLPFIAILFVFGITIGIFSSAMIFRLGPSAEWLGWPIPLVLSVFSGVYYPIATLPAFMQGAAKILPSSYVFESMRNIVSGGAASVNLAYNLFLGALLALIYLFFASYYFIRVYRHNLKDGAIPRFNAESL